MLVQVSDAVAVIRKAAVEFYGDDPERITKAENHPVARMVAAMPFASECDNPEELAAANLRLVFTGARDPSLHPHKPHMSLRARLKVGDIFSTARRPEIAEKGMLYLELFSLEDHKADLWADTLAGKYNPLNDGMDYDEEKGRIERQMAIIGPTDLDPMAMSALSDDGTISFWYG
jgi:hypothetical protein